MTGVGIDIVEVSRFRKKGAAQEALLRAMFTDREIAYCRSKRDPAERFAARFAAKEATWKALSGIKGLPHLFLFLKKAEIINDKRGKPKLKINIPRFNKYKTTVSLSHSGDYAAAVVIIQ